MTAERGELLDYAVYQALHPGASRRQFTWDRAHYNERARRNGTPTLPPLNIPQPVTDKKVGVFNWREWSSWIKEGQALKAEASGAQDYAHVEIDSDRPIGMIVLGDWHIGSWATDYAAVERMTDEILSIPDLYVALVGDMEQMAIKLRGVLEVMDNAISPALQHEWIRSWMTEMGPRVLFSTWDNHSVMREENQSGTSMYADIMKRRVVYHNGIGHVDVRVGDETYHVAASHTFRGRSIHNPVHGQMRYIAHEGHDREIIIAGDSHVPGIAHFLSGGAWRLAVNCGSLQVGSGYAKRFYSLKTSPTFPVVVLHPDHHEFHAYKNVEAWLNA